MRRALAFLVAGFSAVPIPQAEADAPWPQFGRNAVHAGRAEAHGLQAGRLLWSRPVTGPVQGGVVIDEAGRIFVAGTDGRVAGVTSEGTVLWTAGVGGAVYSTPALTGSDRLVVATASGQLVELSSVDGHEIRRVDLAAPVGESSPVVGSDGTILVGTSSGRLVAVNEAGVSWSATTGGGIYGSPAIGGDGTAYAASADQRLRAFAPDGSVRWSLRLSDYPGHSSPVISPAGDIFLGARDGRLYSVSATGSLRWAVALTPAVVSGTPAIGPDGTIFVGTSDGIVAALAPGNGATRWRTTVGGGVSGAVAVAADGTVYAATDSGGLVALDAAGRLAWTVPLGSSLAGSPAVDRSGRVAVGTAEGALAVVTADSSWFVPAAARAEGQGGAIWRTDLRILNAGGAAATVSISFIDRDSDGSAAPTSSIDIPAGATRRLEDVVGGFFGRAAGAGGLRITSPEPKLVVTSRTYNQTPAGTYGQGIPGFPLSASITAESPAEIPGLVENESYRSNLGFQNATSAAVEIRADFRSESGASIATKSWTLAPYSQVQATQVLAGITTTPADGVRATVTVVGGGAAFAFASVVDNRTGDPVFVSAVVPGR